MHTVLVWLLLTGNPTQSVPARFPEHFATQQDCEAVGRQLKQIYRNATVGPDGDNFETKCISAKVIPTDAFTQG